MENLKAKFWTIDEATLSKLQVLKQFVDFVSEQAETDEMGVFNADSVKQVIEHLDDPVDLALYSFNVGITIYRSSIEVENGRVINVKEGVFRREWGISLEEGRFFVGILEEYIDENGEQKVRKIFTCFIDFHKDWQRDHVMGNSNFDEFVAEVKNFRTQLSADLDAVHSRILVYVDDPSDSNYDVCFN